MNLGIFFYYPIILGEKDLLSAAWEPPQLSEGELDMPSPYGERVGTRDSVMSAAWEPPQLSEGELDMPSPYGERVGTRDSVMSAAWEPPQLDERSRYLRRGGFDDLFPRAKL